jgi:hypothetical protein
LHDIPPSVCIPLNAAEVVAFYIMNTLKKLNSVPIQQLFCMNGAVELLPRELAGLFNSPKANSDFGNQTGYVT